MFFRNPNDCRMEEEVREGLICAAVRYGFCHFNVLSDSSSCYWRGMLFRMLFLLFATASIPVASLLHADETFENAGRLLVAGGGVRSANEEMWEWMFKERLHDGPIGIISTASADPLERSAREVENLTNKYGPNRVVAIPLQEGDDSASDPEVVDLIGQCSGFFFTGGQQSRTTRTLLTEEGEPTPAMAAIWEVYQRGGVIGGSSAGAAIMSNPMINGGTSSNALLRGATAIDVPRSERGVTYYFGPGFHPDVLYCQHHIERGRFGRLLSALASEEFPQTIGIGVAEDTFVLVDHEENVGTMLGARGGLYLDVSKMERNGDGGFSGVRLHRLDRGDGVEFTTGKVRPASGREEVEGAISADNEIAVEDAWARDAIWDLLADLGPVGPRAVGVAHDENFDLIFEKSDETRVWRGPAEEEGGEPRWTVTDIIVSVVRRN